MGWHEFIHEKHSFAQKIGVVQFILGMLFLGSVIYTSILSRSNN